jgi:enoyl-CoA hydratase/carnithine racemase
MRFSTKILPSRCGNVGILELNSLKSLNALDLGMVRAMTDVLSHWQKDETLKLTLVTSVPSSSETGQRKVFCAGGDVKSIYESIVQLPKKDDVQENGLKKVLVGYGIPGHVSADFFREEYTLNYRMATQQHHKLPQVSLWDGIVMGGGVGISIHGKYRVATENSLFSMPETAIGFFPGKA